MVRNGHTLWYLCTATTYFYTNRLVCTLHTDIICTNNSGTKHSFKVHSQALMVAYGHCPYYYIPHSRFSLHQRRPISTRSSWATNPPNSANNQRPKSTTQTKRWIYPIPLTPYRNVLEFPYSEWRPKARKVRWGIGVPIWEIGVCPGSGWWYSDESKKRKVWNEAPLVCCTNMLVQIKGIITIAIDDWLWVSWSATPHDGVVILDRFVNHHVARIEFPAIFFSIKMQFVSQ
jgi:hypothetical protein